jgi:hypothetical protein
MLSCACEPGALGPAAVKKIVVVCAATMILAGCGHGGVRGNNPPPAGPDQQVHLIWKQATNEWMVKINNGPEVKPSDAHTPLPKGTGPTKVTVDIAGNTLASFKNSGGLSAWTTGSKLQPQNGINSTQILGPVVTKDGKLVFYDLNQGDAVTIYYSIHLDNSPKPDVDPIMDNGGSN